MIMHDGSRDQLVSCLAPAEPAFSLLDVRRDDARACARGEKWLSTVGLHPDNITNYKSLSGPKLALDESYYNLQEH